MLKIAIVGGGLSGCEAAFQILSRSDYSVDLFEMRPQVQNEAHTTGDLAELVCSNSLKSLAPFSAHAQMKWELWYLNSLILNCALKCAVPAGDALGVERQQLSLLVKQTLQSFAPRFQLILQEINDIKILLKEYDRVIMASGPLSRPDLVKSIQTLGNLPQAYFYDAISPIVAADSLDLTKMFVQNRYNHEFGITLDADPNTQTLYEQQFAQHDYINCPFNQEQYEHFVDELLKGECFPYHSFEEQVRYFNGCQPVEAIAERGRESLRYGPMRPIGLKDPRTQKRPYAVIQLRKENKAGTAWSLVGFQTKLKVAEQQRVFKMIPGLEHAEFYRFGSLHRNTYFNSPLILNKNGSLKFESKLWLAGQITGVEGYLESTSSGLMVALNILGHTVPPNSTVLGALWDHCTGKPKEDYQPMNANFGLLPFASEELRQDISETIKRVYWFKNTWQLPRFISDKIKNFAQIEQARSDFKTWQQQETTLQQRPAEKPEIKLPFHKHPWEAKDFNYSDLRVILLDIEGTTTPIDFVTQTLFPYALKNLAPGLEKLKQNSERWQNWLKQWQQDLLKLKEQNLSEELKTSTATCLKQLETDSLEDLILEKNLELQIKYDIKATALKALQGQIWQEGYASGELHSEVYEDVPKAFRLWRHHNLRIAIYSSGSVNAQKLLFEHTPYGNLNLQIQANFDTQIGGKKEAASYKKIAQELSMSKFPHQILFISDNPEELLAAFEAGMRIMLSVRPGNAPVDASLLEQRGLTQKSWPSSSDFTKILSNANQG